MGPDGPAAEALFRDQGRARALAGTWGGPLRSVSRILKPVDAFCACFVVHGLGPTVAPDPSDLFFAHAQRQKRIGDDMSIEHIKALKMSRAKLLDNRRAISKRDSISERNEGFAERIVSIQAAIEATDRAIAEEEATLAPGAAPPSIG